jgi:hypothetical protein
MPGNVCGYVPLKETWKGIEPFFVSYAVRGPMDVPAYGLQAGLPVNHPISGPVSEPSPLNTRWKYELPDVKIEGIL